MFIAIQNFKSNPSKIITNRLRVRAFKSANDLGAFLCKQDNSWQGVEREKIQAQKYPTKSGVYAYAGGAWHNVKSLDASVLAHI